MMMMMNMAARAEDCTDFYIHFHLSRDYTAAAAATTTTNSSY